MTEQGSASSEPLGVEAQRGSGEAGENIPGETNQAMAPSALGRLFGVPFLIIAGIVGAAMVVVLLTSPSPAQRPTILSN